MGGSLRVPEERAKDWHLNDRNQSGRIVADVGPTLSSRDASGAAQWRAIDTGALADICVVGAGISGVSAAIEAARLGRKVILIDGLPALGGQAVNSIIGMIVGLFGNPPKSRQLTHGIADDIIRDLSATGDLHIVMGGVSLNALYNEVALGRWVERKVLELGSRL